MGEEIHKLKEAKSVKLNPERWVLGAPQGMVSEFIISKRGIEANQEKTLTIARHPEPSLGVPGGLHAPPGKAACHRRCSGARNVQAGRRSRRGLRQRLERPTATSLLPLRCFQVVRIPRSHTSLSRQGRVGLASAEPDPPSGAKRGNPSASRLGVPLRVQNFRSKRLLRSSGYVRSRAPRSERGCM
jgi:hypothetical protein